MPVTDVSFDGDAFGAGRPDVQSVLEQMWEKMAQLVTDLNAMPTADPLIAGRLWNNAGVVNVSAGEV